MKLTILLLGALASAGAQQVKINEIQLVGTHNSYHSGISPNEMVNYRKLNPRGAMALEYRHPSLETQLNDGVRQLEIDVYGDTKGGLFAHPQGPVLAAKAGLPPDPPFDPSHIMMKPGFKVLHVQEFDYRSNCEPFVNCLAIVRAWSKAHPGHLPVFLLVENKDGAPRTESGATPEPLTAATFDALDAEVRSVFPPSETIAPDDVRGSHKTLNEAILAEGWPTLDQARGKVIFLLDQRRVGPLYTKGHPSLDGRVFFTNAVPGTPDAAFTECNNSAGDPQLVPSLIRKGYLVRTMTDPGVDGVKSNETARRDASIQSGAQILSTDYPAGEPAESGYFVTVSPAGPAHPNARCNPVLKPAGCTDAMLQERPRAYTKIASHENPWRRHSCLPRRDSSRRFWGRSEQKGRDDSRPGRHECPRHIRPQCQCEVVLARFLSLALRGENQKARHGTVAIPTQPPLRARVTLRT